MEKEDLNGTRTFASVRSGRRLSTYHSLEQIPLPLNLLFVSSEVRFYLPLRLYTKIHPCRTLTDMSCNKVSTWWLKSRLSPILPWTTKWRQINIPNIIDLFFLSMN